MRSSVIRPPLESLDVSGYVLSDYEDLDRAGRWDICQPTCSEAAYLINLHPDLASARAAVSERGRALSKRILPFGDPRELTRLDPLWIRIFHVSAVGIVGRDYRPGGCRLPDWHTELHSGNGDERAWRELRRQRRCDDLEGVLLPGRTPVGDLFLFAQAAPERLVERELVEVRDWHWND